MGIGRGDGVKERENKKHEERRGGMTRSVKEEATWGLKVGVSEERGRRKTRKRSRRRRKEQASISWRIR